MPITQSRHTLTALLTLICSGNSVSANAHSIDFDPDWLRIEKRAVLDHPEQAVSAMTLLRREQADSPPQAFKSLLSEHNGLFFLNLYQDLVYQQRTFKFGPVPLLSNAELSHCRSPSSGVVYAERWAGEKGLTAELDLYLISFRCAQGESWQNNRLLLVDHSMAGTPLIAIGRALNRNTVEFSALQTVAKEHSERWRIALEAGRSGFDPWLPQPQSALQINIPQENSTSPMQQLRRLHQTAFSSTDKDPVLEQLSTFLQRYDYRQLGLGEQDYPGLLNDIAYWLTQAGQLDSARPLLLEVLRREPQRMPTHLNLADLDWQLFLSKAWPAPAERAREHYRIYCGLRLAKNLRIPPRVAQRLQTKQLNAELCRAHWPLIQAIDADDMATARSLLDSGIPPVVVAEDGRSALLHALDKPNLELAALLVERGAKLSGLNNGLPLVTHALRADIKQYADLSHAQRLPFLVNAGAAIDEVDYRGETLLMQFSREASGREILFALLKYPQNLDIRDQKGNTALAWALDWQNMQAVEWLASEDADLNFLYKQGTCGGNNDRTIQHSALLELASYSNRQLANAQLFTTLLAYGADPTLGQDCELPGYDLLLLKLVHNQRSDVLNILAKMNIPRAPLNPKVSDAAQIRLQNSQGDDERDQARQVFNALRALSPP